MIIQLLASAVLAGVGVDALRVLYRVLNDKEHAGDQKWSTTNVLALAMMFWLLVISSPYLLYVHLKQKRLNRAEQAKNLLAQTPGRLP